MNTLKIGEFLKSLRRAKGYTQQQIADELFLSAKTISKWENGDGLPDVSTLPSLADLYNVTIDEILRGERKNSQKETIVSDKTQTINNKNKLKLLKGKLIEKYNSYFYTALTMLLALFLTSVIVFFCPCPIIISYIIIICAQLISLLILFLGNKSFKNYASDFDEEIIITASNESKAQIKNFNYLFCDVLFATLMVFVALTVIFIIGF